MIDPCGIHNSIIEENRKLMAGIETEKPNDYFQDKEWRRLNEENRHEYRLVEKYQRMKDMGVKF